MGTLRKIQQFRPWFSNRDFLFVQLSGRTTLQKIRGQLDIELRSWQINREQFLWT